MEEALKWIIPSVLSLFALYIAFRKDKRDEQKSAIEALQLQMDGMEKKLKEEQTKNHLITEILQGRDETTQDFQEKGYKSFRQIHDIHQIIVIDGKKD